MNLHSKSYYLKYHIFSSAFIVHIYVECFVTIFCQQSKGSKFSGRYHFVEYSDTNDSPIYKSEETYKIATFQSESSSSPSSSQSEQSSGKSYHVERHTEKAHLYLGKLNGKGIEGWTEPDFWSLNTQQDMFGDYFAQFESSLRVPLYPQNGTDLVWKSVYDQDFDQFSITIPDNGKFKIFISRVYLGTPRAKTGDGLKNIQKFISRDLTSNNREWAYGLKIFISRDSTG